MYPQRQTFLTLGLSRSGLAAAEFLLRKKARVYIYDDLSSEGVEKNAEKLEQLGAIRVQTEELSHMYEKCDVLVLSPGIPVDHPVAVSFKRNKKAVVGETELAARYMRCNVVAVTGTNGKTTTTSMIGKILKDAGFIAELCGNIGTPMLEFCNLPEDGVAVAEISSFQLETLSSLCPHVAVVLNIAEDHLNRHYNMENYIFLKSRLMKNSSEAEYAVLNYDDGIVRGFAERAKANVVFFSLRERVNGAYLLSGDLYYGEEKFMSENELITDGAHNVANALAAIAVAKIMGVDSATIASSLKSFKGIRHRIEPVSEADGVSFIDDSKATNVDATIKAVGCMKQDTILLLGGKDKGYEYDKLFTSLRSSKVRAAVLYGENRFLLLESALRCGYKDLLLCPNFSFAVNMAKAQAKSGETVLLSPASASFDEFSGYEERGDRFVEIVREYERESGVQLEDVAQEQDE